MKRSEGNRTARLKRENTTNAAAAATTTTTTTTTRSIEKRTVNNAGIVVPGACGWKWWNDEWSSVRSARYGAHRAQTESPEYSRSNNPQSNKNEGK
jgi:hypothetical protein